MFCKCIGVRKPKDALLDLIEEIQEFIEEPSSDELSDIAFALGRLFGGIIGKVYISMPGDSLHIKKMSERMSKYGCVRSERHLINGRCPSE